MIDLLIAWLAGYAVTAIFAACKSEDGFITRWEGIIISLLPLAWPIIWWINLAYYAKQYLWRKP